MPDARRPSRHPKRLPPPSDAQPFDTPSDVVPADPPGPPARPTLQFEGTLSYNSPIPPPQILAGYNAIVSPDAAERILRMVEQQEAHRRELERTVVTSDNRRANWGLVSGTLIMLATIYMAIRLVEHGQPAYAIAGVISAMAAVAGVFVYGTNSRRQALKDRLELQMEHMPTANAPRRRKGRTQPGGEAP